MRLSKTAPLLLLATALASPAVAEGFRRPVSTPAPNVVGAVSHLLLPTSANVNGQFGAVFKTKVSIHNATSRTYDIRAGLSVGSGEIDARSIRIFPNETLTYGNFLADVFGFTGGGAIDLDSGNANDVFIVSSQVYVDTASGRYTTSVQFADDLGAIVPNRPGFVIGLSVNSAFRVNVGCASNASQSQTITFSAFDKDYNLVGSSFSFTLAGFGWAQYGVNLALNNGGIFIEATRNAVCYAVEVNNLSNDGTYQLAVPF